MTASDYKKTLKQLEVKPVKLKKYIKHNFPKERKFGRGTKKCKRCGRVGRGFIEKYDINLCRQCFREVAKKIGFFKYS